MLDVTRRRLVAAAVAAFASPAAFAQAERVRRIGVLAAVRSNAPNNMDVFFEGMRELGYVQGRNLVVEVRMAQDGEDSRLPALAAELVKLDVEVILAAGPAATRAAKGATSTVPIVMGTVDPVEQGLIASLAQPGGNITGWCFLSTESVQKQLALLKEAIPRASRVGVIAGQRMTQLAQRAGELARGAAALGVKLVFVEVSSAGELEPAFATLRKERVDGFVLIPEPALDALREPVAALAVQHRMPGMYSFRLYVDAGGLMSYGPNLRTMIAVWPGYVDKILKGMKPGVIPVQTPTKYELVINQKAAKQIGFTFPGGLLLAADSVVS